MPTDPRQAFPTGEPVPEALAPWNILVVDDEPDVHDATLFALKGVRILGRPLLLHRASSAAEAEAVMERFPDMAVALVDVVMESNDAGLRLVSRLRDLGYETLRLILRTGQPGYAPELTVINDFDINDYRCKDDLTRTRLISLLTTALRDFSQIRQLNDHRRGLELVIESTQDLMDRRGIGILGQGILTQLATLLNLPARGIVCAASMNATAKTDDQFMVLAGLGTFQSDVGRPLVLVGDYQGRLAAILAQARRGRAPVVLEDGLAVLFDNPGGRAYFVFVEGQHLRPTAIQSDLLRLFSTNIALCFENLDMVDRLDELAFTDVSLRIPNRNALAHRVDQTHEAGKVSRLVTFSLDTVMDIAGVFGSKTAVQAFLAFRDMILDTLPGVTFICRFGDRSLVALGAPQEMPDAAIRALRSPSVPVEGMPMALPATISILDLDLGALSGEDVIRMVLTANLAAQDRGGDDLHRFDPSVTQALAERLRLLFALRDALDRDDGIDAHFQAKVDLTTGRITGAEALCRWTLEGKPISPGTFIPLAETGGLSRQLTWTMLDRIAAFARRRADRGLPPLPVAINLSMVDFETDNFAETLLAQVGDRGLTPDSLSFEITEGAVMRDPDRVLGDLRYLHDRGFELSVDDFGTGHSSLARVQTMPVDTLKIDRAFVTPLTPDTCRRGIAAVTMIMADDMNLDVVAEGVETEEQHQSLAALGCETGQGFLYARPMDRESFEALLDAGPRPLPPGRPEV
jgi:EAL domain-containing protein (putative c-di-GMP-specific phosphodiesterase class I)/CheY-like chemotaxis protein